MSEPVLSSGSVQKSIDPSSVGALGELRLKTPVEPSGATATDLSIQSNLGSADGLKPSVVRPIQYLGSKLRALDVISDKVEEELRPGATVLDLFAGSTVVSQSLADSGFRIVASDAMQYTQHFATALLGINRCLSNLDCNELAELIIDGADLEKLSNPLSKWLNEERIAVSAGDGARLIELSKVFPQVWRGGRATGRLSSLFDQLRLGVGGPGFETSGIVTAYYASTYFGIEQAIAIDSLRCSIETAKSAGLIDEWSYNSSIVALLSCASKAAFTPGKHFAQYHKLSGSKNLDFHQRRILSDRRVDIVKEFRNSLYTIFGRPFGEGASHRAMHRSMEQLLTGPDDLGDIDLIYADPPYTAQQYSRFYHLPEIISCYRIPELQLVSGKPTTGLYDSNRFKSRFSSKRFAPEAFRDLAALAHAKNCDLIVSYSDSKSGVTGNSRMISLDALKKIFMESFASVEVVALDLQYRQFNSGTSTVSNKEDRELMIHCRKC